MDFYKSIEREYFLSQLLCKIYDVISSGLNKKKQYLLQEIWENFLITNKYDHYNVLNFLDNCKKQSIMINENDLKHHLMKLNHDDFDTQWNNGVIVTQPLVDTQNTFIYKKFKKVINVDVYKYLLQKTADLYSDILQQRSVILIALLRYNNINSRKAHMMLHTNIIDQFILHNEPFIDGYSSPFCKLPSAESYYSLFDDNILGSSGNIQNTSFSTFVNKILVLHPPHIESFVIQCIDFVCNLISYIKYEKKSIKIILAIPKRFLHKDNPSTSCYKQILNHTNLIKQNTEFFKTTLYNYYDYNGMLKTIHDDIIVIFELIV